MQRIFVVETNRGYGLVVKALDSNEASNHVASVLDSSSKIIRTRPATSEDFKRMSAYIPSNNFNKPDTYGFKTR